MIVISASSTAQGTLRTACQSITHTDALMVTKITAVVVVVVVVVFAAAAATVAAAAGAGQQPIL